ncbi:MAG TPA: cupin domain-containing protein [Burkholderiales bacterium]|nr:cupin domain-containing protein [Burkholderiales bacterium]
MKMLKLAAAVSSMFAVSTALAGECPADKRVPDGRGQKMVNYGPKDVTDKVRASTDLSKEAVALPGHLFRLRELEVKPGGIVPWHSHDARPAMIYIVIGEIIEYASNCAVPIVHKAGDVAPEAKGTSHWWQNHGKATSKLISVDIFPTADKKHDEKMM